MDGSPSRGKVPLHMIILCCRVFESSHLEGGKIDEIEKWMRTIGTDVLLGETIPIRLFLGGFDLTPTFRDVNKKYSTRYYLSLVLIDEGQPSVFSGLCGCCISLALLGGFLGSRLLPFSDSQ